MIFKERTKSPIWVVLIVALCGWRCPVACRSERVNVSVTSRIAWLGSAVGIVAGNGQTSVKLVRHAPATCWYTSCTGPTPAAASDTAAVVLHWLIPYGLFTGRFYRKSFMLMPRQGTFCLAFSRCFLHDDFICFFFFDGQSPFLPTFICITRSISD